MMFAESYIRGAIRIIAGRENITIAEGDTDYVNKAVKLGTECEFKMKTCLLSSCSRSSEPFLP